MYKIMSQQITLMSIHAVIDWNLWTIEEVQQHPNDDKPKDEPKHVMILFVSSACAYGAVVIVPALIPRISA
jgi:hypothetical protein